MGGSIVLILMYLVGVVFPGFFAPYGKQQEFDQIYTPPTKIQFIDEEGQLHLRPFVYKYEQHMDPETWQIVVKPDKSKKFPIHFFVRGKKYNILGLFETNIHLFGVEEGGDIFIFGTDDIGRDIFSRSIYAMRISLTIGFVGIGLTMIFGLLFGGLSAIIGGIVDDIIQRIIELLLSIPKIPLWMALSASIPKRWSPLTVYFVIIIILSFMSWTRLARVVRSKFISLREEDFVLAARSFNTYTMTIIWKHMVPNFISYILVHLTLAIPGMILAETSLSFLGIGLRPPIVSLGVLLERAQSFQNVSMFPWILIPGVLVVISVLAFNFVGDGLRDAADPYQ